MILFELGVDMQFTLMLEVQRMRYGRLQKIVIAALALIGAAAIVFVMANYLMRSSLIKSSGMGAFSGGINMSLFPVLILMIAVIVLALIVLRRGRRLR